jgi:Tat protein translocase TatB subunit
MDSPCTRKRLVVDRLGGRGHDAIGSIPCPAAIVKISRQAIRGTQNRAGRKPGAGAGLNVCYLVPICTKIGIIGRRRAAGAGEDTMELFGVGAGELFLIMVIALVVIGPERLPEVAGQIGRTVADLRRQANQLTGEFQRSLEVAVQERQEQKAPVAPAPRFCGSCGSPMADAARYCASCGTPVAERPADGER